MRSLKNRQLMPAWILNIVVRRVTVGMRESTEPEFSHMFPYGVDCWIHAGFALLTAQGPQLDAGSSSSLRAWPSGGTGLSTVPIILGSHRTAVVRKPLWATIRWAGRTLRSATCQGLSRVSVVSNRWKRVSFCNAITSSCTCSMVGKKLNMMPPITRASPISGTACQGYDRKAYQNGLIIAASLAAFAVMMTVLLVLLIR